MVAGISKILKTFTGAGLTQGSKDDDAVDRLNHIIMHGILIFLAIFTGTKQYTGSPIKCWLPAQYPEKFQRYFANNYCWVQTLYNVPFEDSIPVEEEKRYYNDVSFYRWATMIFIFLAALFRVPRLIWKELKKFTGVNIDKLVEMSVQTSLMDQDKRDEQLSYVAEYIHRWVTTRKFLSRTGRRAFLRISVPNFLTCYSKRSGHILVFSYLLIKLLYLLNSVGQFFIISVILKTNYWTFGTTALAAYIQDGQWEDEDIFPRVALCDMKVHNLGNVYIYTLQCVLGINLFLEKFFFILWFCLMAVLIMNIASFAKWSFELLTEARTVEFLTKYCGQIFPPKPAANEERKMFIAMAKSYLQADGVFVIRLVAENISDVLVVDLIRQIWFRYKDSVVQRVKNTDEEDTLKNEIIENHIEERLENRIDNVDK